MYPDFEFDVLWYTDAHMDSCSAFQLRRNRNDVNSSNEQYEGATRIFLVDEVDESQTPGDEVREKIDWLIANQNEIVSGAIETLFNEYPEIREGYELEHGGDTSAVLPDLAGPEDLKTLIGELTFHIHPTVVDEKPYVGISAICTWDREHGLGWLMLGSEVRIFEQAEVAMTKWMVDQDSQKSVT